MKHTDVLSVGVCVCACLYEIHINPTEPWVPLDYLCTLEMLRAAQNIVWCQKNLS